MSSFGLGDPHVFEKTMLWLSDAHMFPTIIDWGSQKPKGCPQNVNFLIIEPGGVRQAKAAGSYSM